MAMRKSTIIELDVEGRRHIRAQSYWELTSLQSLALSDPAVCCLGIGQAEELDLTWNQECKGAHGTFQPTNIGDNCDTLPVRQVRESDLNILEHRAGLDQLELWADSKK